MIRLDLDILFSPHGFPQGCNAHTAVNQLGVMPGGKCCMLLLCSHVDNCPLDSSVASCLVDLIEGSV